VRFGVGSCGFLSTKLLSFARRIRNARVEDVSRRVRTLHLFIKNNESHDRKNNESHDRLSSLRHERRSRCRRMWSLGISTAFLLRRLCTSSATLA
jgi:hypothetical protein